MSITTIKIGCCGFPRGMKNYYRTFELAEVQTTFYQLPLVETAERWRFTAPKKFEFSLKAWQGITHPASSPTYRRFGRKLENPENYGSFQQTDEVADAWKETEKICAALEARYVVFQCPASFTPTDENLGNMIWFFKKIRTSKYRFAWEPRGPAWTDNIVADICKRAGLLHCVDPFARQSVTTDRAYFRLHGCPPGKKMYYYDYTKKDLATLLKICEQFKEVHCLFNNMNMYQNASEFGKLCAAHKLV